MSDLAQSVCREVLESAGRFEYRGEAAFVRWFQRLALSKILEKRRYYRARKRDVGREVGLEAPGQDPPTAGELYATFATPSRQAVRAEELASLAEAFDRLPPDYQEVIGLARLWDLPHREVAALMGRSEAASRALLHRAVARLGLLMASQET